MLDTTKELRVIRLLLTVVALPVVFMILRTMKTVFIPLILAIFLSFLFAPLIQWLQKRRVPMFAILILLLFIILLFFSFVSWLFYTAGDNVAREFPVYQARFETMIRDAQNDLSNTLESMNVALEKIPLLDISEQISSGGFSITKMITGTMGTFLNIGTTLFLTMLFMLFTVAGQGQMEKRLRRVLTEERQEQTLQTISRIQRQIQRYFLNKSLISLGTALLGVFFMLVFGINFVVVAGILLFALNFIPNIGSIIATLFPIVICLIDYGFGWTLVGITLSLISTQVFFANIMEPKVMGERLNLTPIMVLISLVFWALVWGVVGMMLAVPITSVINIVLKEMDEKNLVSAIISDQ